MSRAARARATTLEMRRRGSARDCAWVFLLSMIILMPTVTPWLRKRLEGLDGRFAQRALSESSSRREAAGGNRDAALAACLVAGAGVHQELQLSQCVVGPGGQDFPQFRAAQLRSLSLACDALQVSLVTIDGIPERKSHGFAPSR